MSVACNSTTSLLPTGAVALGNPEQIVPATPPARTDHSSWVCRRLGIMADQAFKCSADADISPRLLTTGGDG
jgi:hypothetical protein